MPIFEGGAWFLLGLETAMRWVTLGSKGNSSLSSFCLCRVPAPRGGYLYNFLTAAVRAAGRSPQDRSGPSGVPETHWRISDCGLGFKGPPWGLGGGLGSELRVVFFFFQ